MTPADVLDAAADLIERDGWWDGGWRRGLGHCPVSASYEFGVCPMEALNALADRVDVEPDVPYWERIATWNDAQDGPDKVVWTMRQVAANLREGGG